jgi:predicted TIM-barrel fold metal-dependent hydrolase
VDDLSIVSVDDHVIEPPELWQTWVPHRLREQAPRVLRIAVSPDDPRVPDKLRDHVIETPDGTDFWSYDGKLVPLGGLNATAGVAREDYTLDPVNFDEIRPGCFQVPARIADMDLDGVAASLVFPSFTGFAGRVFVEAKDKDLALACVRAYNDWMIEEWCGAAPNRLIPLCLAPLWDADATVREMHRVAAKGARAIAFSENPAKLGLPSIHDANRSWDPVFDAAVDLELPLCMHIGSSSGTITTSDDAPRSIFVGLVPLNAQVALFDWMLSDTLQRHPRLQLVLSEGGIGWIPYVLERIDYAWEHQGAWTHTTIREPPSTFFARHFHGCFISDRHGVANLDAIGVDNVMLETDYPHSDSTWPDSRRAAGDALAGLDETTIRKVSRENAERLFRFTAPAHVPERASATRSP